MINEQDVDKFKENESTFIDYWSSRQKKFIEYYQSEYKTKAGKFTHASYYDKVKLNTPFQKSGPCVTATLTIITQIPTCW